MEWILKNFIYSEERGRPYLMSWIHSHVGGAECFFSSVDVHTQHTLAKFHEAVIGMVIQLNENDEIAHHDFYEMSRQGLRHVENCSKKRNCNSRQQHDSCYNTNLYKTASHKVMLHDDVGLRVQNFMLPMVNNKRKGNDNTGHVIHSAEETGLERILKKNEYYKRQKKDPEFVEIEEAEETELEKILKKNDYYARLKKDQDFVEILNKPDEFLLPQPSTSKQEDIQIIGKKPKLDNAGHVSTYPINL